MSSEQSDITTIGIDACRGGWVTATMRDHQITSFELFRDLLSHLEDLKKVHLIFIDIPIGLPEKEQPRRCDGLLRKSLRGRYASSVFSVPVRKAVFADDYPTANALNKEISGKGVSKQSWNICGKVREADVLLDQQNDLREKMLECHPELAFQVETGGEVFEKKKTEEGFRQRLKALNPYLNKNQVVDFLNETLRKDVQPDDVLDAAINAVSAWKAIQFGMKTIPITSEKDATGKPMNIHIPNYGKTED